MQVRCPHCHNPIAIVDDSSFKDIVCGSCGSCFSLVGGTDATETTQSPEAKTVGHFDLIEELGIGAFGKVWKAKSSLVIRDFLVAGDKAILAGHSTSKDMTTGKIAIFSTKDGKLLKEFDISSPPVYQGMAVAGVHLFIATEKGSVICLENQ